MDIALTALGTIMPVLRDSGDLGTPLGVTILALVGAGMLSVLLFPLIALAVRRRPPDA